jgi:60 kDa SS-A/Ro ribonucleoprotein
MSKIDLIFGTRKGVPTPDSTNYAGGPSYTRNLEERTLQVLTTNVFENTFYATQKDLVKEAVDLFKQMALKDSSLFAKMIVYARNKGYIRLAPITALVVLSTADIILFEVAFPLVIRTPGDLQDFMAIVRSKSLRQGCGRGVKRTVGAWLNSLSEYHTIKYGSKGNDFSLRDILRLIRPVPKDEQHKALFSYLCEGLSEKNAVTIANQLNQVKCMELLKEETDLDRQKALIAEGRLPYEVVIGCIKPNVQLWTELMRQMPFFALLRHLNTLQKAGVFNSKENVAYVVSKLTDEKTVQGSKVLPFRFFTAYHTMESGMPRQITEALEQALEISFQNVPELAGRTAVGCDTSGSMSGQLSAKGNTRYIDIAAIFTAAMLKKTADALILPFDTRLHMDRFSARDSLMTTARTLSSKGGGGTNVGLPLEYLLQNKIVVDTFIGVTDSESWVGRGFLPAWREYKRKVAPKAKAFLIELAPYGHAVAPQSEPDVWYFYGWSETVLPFISMTVNGQATQLDAVRAVTFRSPGNTETVEDSD